MMAVFVRKHVRFGERPPFCAKAALQFVEEREVQVDFLIAWTIEWPHGGRCVAAGRLRCLRKEDSIGLAILPTLPGKFVSPEGLDAVDEPHNAAILTLVGIGSCLA